MNEPTRVHVLERIVHPPCQTERVADDQRPAAQAGGGSPTRQPLHHEEGLAVLGDAVVHVADHRLVLEARERVGLPREPLRAPARGEDLEPTWPPEVRSLAR